MAMAARTSSEAPPRSLTFCHKTHITPIIANDLYNKDQLNLALSRKKLTYLDITLKVIFPFSTHILELCALLIMLLAAFCF